MIPKKIIFDDVDLRPYIMVEKVRKSFYNIDKIQLEVDFSIVNDVQKKMDKLNQILLVKEPKKLYYNMLPDRYLIYRLDGEISFEEFKNTVRGTMKFISDYNYWVKSTGDKIVSESSLKVIEVNNEGSAPTYPRFEVKFRSDNGYLGIIAPNGYLSLGSMEQQDRQFIPATVTLLDSQLSSADSFTDELNASSIPDYQKLDLGHSAGQLTQSGLGIKRTTNPKDGFYWNSYGFSKLLNNPKTGSSADNFELTARLRFFDSSGTTNNTGMYLICLMTTDGKPIMTTSIYNVDSNSNIVTVSAKINSFEGNQLKSKIIHQKEFPAGFDGTIRMTKEGSTFNWFWDSGRQQITKISSAEKFSIGNVVYIKNNANFGYGDDYVKYSIKDFTRGRAYTLTEVRTYKGQRQFVISYQGTRVYWINESDLTANRSGVGPQIQNYSEQTSESFTTRQATLASLQLGKVFIISGVWDSSNPFTNANLTDLVIKKLNGQERWDDIKNTFSNGDTLLIDNSNGQILLNGSPFTGFMDYDSRFFSIDYGKSDIEVLVSNWSAQPLTTIKFEERYR